MYCTAPMGLERIGAGQSAGRPPLIALTFDDGPGAATERILDCFEQHSCAGTFFVLGKNIESREHVLRRAVAGGSEVGVHTMTHPRLSELKDERVELELRMCAEEITRAVGLSPTVMRPPYGDLDERTHRIARRLGLKTVIWSLRTSDWDGSRRGVIADRILASARPGAVVVMHDSGPDAEDRTETAFAVETVVPALQDAGYTLTTVSDLIARDRRAAHEVVVQPKSIRLLARALNLIPSRR